MNSLDEELRAHLWEDSLASLVAQSITSTDENTLLLVECPTEANRLLDEIKTNAAYTPTEWTVSTDAGQQDDLPFEHDQFDVAVHINPGLQPLHRHKPLYNTSTVTKMGGTIVYAAPKWLAESRAVDFETIYAVDWEQGADVYLAAVGTVTVAGQLSQYHSQNLPTSKTSRKTDQIDLNACL